MKNRRVFSIAGIIDNSRNAGRLREDSRELSGAPERCGQPEKL